MSTNITGLTITSNEIKIDYTQGPILPFAYYYGDTEPNPLPSNVTRELFTIKKAEAGDILTRNDIIYFDSKSDSNQNYPPSIANAEIEWYYPMQYTTLGIYVSNAKIPVLDIYKATSTLNLIATNDPLKEIYSQTALSGEMYQFYTTFGRFNAPDNFNNYNFVITPIQSASTHIKPFIYTSSAVVNKSHYVVNTDLPKYYFSNLFILNENTTIDAWKTSLKESKATPNVQVLINNCINDKNYLTSDETVSDETRPDDTIKRIAAKMKMSPLDYLLVYIQDNIVYYTILNKLDPGYIDTFVNIRFNSSLITDSIPSITSPQTVNAKYAYWGIGTKEPSYYNKDYRQIPDKLDFKKATTTSQLCNEGCNSPINPYIALITLYEKETFIEPIKLFSYTITPTNVFMFYGIHSPFSTATHATYHFLTCSTINEAKDMKIYQNNLVAPQELINNVFPDQSLTNSQIFSFNRNATTNPLYDYDIFPFTFGSQIGQTNIIQSDRTLENTFFKPTEENPIYPYNISSDQNTISKNNAMAIYGSKIITLKKDIAGTNLSQLSCTNPFGEIDDNFEKLTYPNVMFTPFTDVGLYPPQLSNGSGLLWQDGYHFKKDDTMCKFDSKYYNYILNEATNTKTTNNFGYMGSMVKDSTVKIPGKRFITLAFLTTSLSRKDPLDIRPCFGSIDFDDISWMYDTMVDYFQGFEKNSLDIWINSIRNAGGDIILSYGGYNGRMSADAFIANKNKDSRFSDANFITNMVRNTTDASYILQKSWDWTSDDTYTALSPYGIDKVNTKHKSDSDYSWGYNGKDAKVNNDQYANNLFACYYLPAKYYKVRWIDFDIEASSQDYGNWKSHIVRIIALKKLMEENKYINVRYTFPTNPVGLAYAYPILWLTMFSFKNCDIQVRKRLYVNLMTMDYGDIAMKEAGFDDNTKYWKDVFNDKYTTDSKYYNQLAIASILAVCNTALQMKKMSKKLYGHEFNWINENGSAKTGDNAKWSEGYLSRIGNTPMIGLNDSNFSALTVKAAETITDFIERTKLIMVIEGSTTNGFTGKTLNSYALWEEGSVMNNTPADNQLPPDFAPYIIDTTNTANKRSLYDAMVTDEGFGPSFGSSGHISMWSINRDIPCVGTQVNINCSGGIQDKTYQTDTLEFSKTFQKGVNNMNSQDKYK